MDIRAIIEDKINKAGITKKELCKRCDIQHANNINTMLSAPSWPTLEKFAKALDISVAELVSEGSANEEKSERASTTAIVCPYCNQPIELNPAKAKKEAEEKTE